MLVDFEAYGEWNPTLPSVSGTPELGERLGVSQSLPSGPRVPFSATVTVVDPERELRWEAGLPSRRVLEGERVFRVEPSDDGVVFEQRERFEGPLAEPVLSRLAPDVRAGFEAMNDALARRVVAERPA